MSTETETKDQRLKRALETFDKRSAANKALAASMVLVEQDEASGVWCVFLWHGVTNRKTRQRVGLHLLSMFASGEAGKARADETARALTWWMQQGLNMHGKGAEVARLQKIIDGLTERVAAQSELLSRRAEVAGGE